MLAMLDSVNVVENIWPQVQSLAYVSQMGRRARAHAGPSAGGRT